MALHCVRFWRVARAFQWGAVFFVEGLSEEVVAGPGEEASLVVHAFLGLQNVGAKVAESACALGRDAVGGKGVEKVAEDVIDVDLREVEFRVDSSRRSEKQFRDPGCDANLGHLGYPPISAVSEVC
jgi:hypothetical protein